MSKLEEIRSQLEKLLGYECVIVKLETYNDNVDEYLKIKNLLLKASDGFRTESYSKDEVEFIAKLRTEASLKAIRRNGK